MKRTRRKTFFDLVAENREELLKDLKALEQIENRLEEKHMKRGKIG